MQIAIVDVHKEQENETKITNEIQNMSITQEETPINPPTDKEDGISEVERDLAHPH